MSSTARAVSPTVPLRLAPPLPDRALTAACLALVAWGVFPFGAVHDWALWPLVSAAALLGAFGCAAGERSRATLVALAAAPLLAAVVAQLLPLPKELIHMAGTGEFLGRYDVGVAADARALHPLSVAPALTARAFLMLAALVAFVCGLAALLDRRPALLRAIVPPLAILAVCVAVFALVQKATFNGKIYWFWESQFRAASNYYGPFVNRNHFAGWMMLATALTAGWLLGQLQGLGRGIKPGWRNRILWLSSPEAGRALMTAALVAVMFVSVLWSMSRSGIGGTTLALCLLAIAAWRRFAGGARRLVALGALAMVLLVAVAWRGADTLSAWYGRTQTFEWRVELWKDTLPALRDFWITGSGLNTYGQVMLLYPQTNTEVHAQQAHNDYLQLAVEGGLLVGIPVLIVVGLFVAVVRRRLAQPQSEMTWWIRMGAVAGICGMAVQSTVEFSLQIPGIAVLFAVMVAIAIHAPAPVPDRHRQGARSSADSESTSVAHSRSDELSKVSAYSNR
jgi:O-antigen ligase